TLRYICLLFKKTNRPVYSSDISYCFRCSIPSINWIVCIRISCYRINRRNYNDSKTSKTECYKVFNVSLGLTLLKQMRENGKMGVQSVPCDLFQNGGKKMRKIGYVRVSSVEQNPARQYHQLEEIGMDRIYEERLSGATQHRPELQKMLEALQTGDTIFVTDLTRITRST